MDFLQPIDVGAFHWFQAVHRPWLDRAVVNLTDLGDWWVVVSFMVHAVVGFLIVGWRRTAVIVLATSLLGLGLSEGTKRVVKRVRPDPGPGGLIPRPRSHSFPSGHALDTMAIYGAVALTAARRVQRRWLGVLLVAGDVGLSLCIGLTRLYLGVHWLSDVCAGWIGGLACALLAFWLDRLWDDRPRAAADTATRAAPARPDAVFPAPGQPL